jgi:hypothetical protein
MKVWNKLQWQSIGLIVSTCEKGNELSDYNKKGNICGLRFLGKLGGVVW